MELMLIGGIVGLIIAVSLTVLYFIFAKFFGVQARALDSNQKASEQLARQVRKEQALQTTGRLDQIDGRESPLSKLPPKQGTSNAFGFHPRTIFPEPDPGRRQVPDRSLRGEKGLWNRKNKFRNLSSTRSMSQSSKRLLAERVHESEVIAAVGLRYVSREYWTTDPATETRHNLAQRNILSTTIGPDYIELQSPPTACLHIKCTSKRLQECQQT